MSPRSVERGRSGLPGEGDEQHSQAAQQFAGSAGAITPLRRPSSTSSATPACGVTSSVSPPSKSMSRAFGNGLRILHLLGAGYNFQLTDSGRVPGLDIPGQAWYKEVALVA